MRKHFSYALLLAVFLAACSEAPVGTATGTTGAAALKISGTRAETTGEYDPLDKLVVSIYDHSGQLLRRYASRENLPERLELLSGSYRAAVEAGERTEASFVKRHYEGEQTFRVEAGVTTPVEVVCSRTNVAANVQFEKSVADNFSRYRVLIAAAETIDDDAIRRGEVPALEFTTDATGYFTLPEGVTTLAWQFEGEHLTRGEQSKSGTLTGLKAGDNCSLGFRFSPDLPGFIECFTLTTEDPDGEDDTIVWTEISIEGDGFEMDQTQDYIVGKTAAKRYKIANATPIASATLTIGGIRYDLLNDVPAGITTDQRDDRHLTLTLSDEFFAGRAGGRHTLSLRVTDRNGGELERTSDYRLQGLLPIEEADYDLWHNTLTLKALVLDTDIRQVTFTLGSEDRQQQLAGIRDNEEIYSATFFPEWNEGTNAAGLRTYAIDTRTGVFPGRSYTCKVILDENETSATFSATVSQPIPCGDMESESLSAYTTSNTDAPFWGSGNNTFTSSLCTWSTYAGMGGEHCTRLAAAEAPLVKLLAAGNFFSGTFKQNGAGGDVYFGQNYAWKARPSGLKLKYHAKIGAVNKTKHAGAGVSSGDQDISVVYVAIVDWSERHRVHSSMDECSGMWSPDNRTATDEGAIIGYGILYLNESTTGDTMVEKTIDMQYYDTQARPEAPYKLVISCSTSLYGDYMTGCTTNELYLDDFEWVY